MTRALRLVAFAIAIAGAVDPAISVSGASRARVAMVVQTTAPGAAAVRDRLARDLSGDFDLVPAVTSDAAAAIVIGNRLPEESLSDALSVSTVTIPPAPDAGVRIVRVDAPRDVPAATAIHLDVELEGLRVAGRTTDVAVEIGGIETGRASHTWSKDAEHWRAEIDAVPLGEPPYLVRVRLKPDTTDPATATGTTVDPATATDATVVSGFSRTSADLVVDARTAPLRVELFEPRPSWAATFLRRALEADARFDVASLSFASKGVAVQTGPQVPLADTRLDAFDVVIVGGLDRLTAADAGALERFMRERGGVVVAVPDQRLTAGPARELIAGPDFVERLLEQPAKLTVAAPAAPIQASELLVLPALSPGAEAIARVPGGDRAPVIVSMPRGDGRLVVSGAMDAWRFRAADGGAFDRFWQSAIAGLALRVPGAIAVDVAPSLLRPGERGDVVVHVRSREAGAVSASIDGEPVRLTPEPEAGAWRGRFTARNAPGRSTIDVRADAAEGHGLHASRTILVRSDVQRTVDTTAPSLSMIASSHRGIDVTPERLGELERFVRGSVSAPRTTLVRHPMRSAWWLLPFAACLSAEWWLRRRKGLR